MPRPRAWAVLALLLLPLAPTSAASGSAPVATITSPADGDVVSGVVTVTGVASDNESDPLVRVTLQVNGMVPFTVNGTANWTATVDFTGFSPGNQTLRARAFGPDNQTGPWHAIRVRVAAPPPPPPNAAPNVTIDSPSDGSTVGRFVDVFGRASDADGAVTQVNLLVDGGFATIAEGTVAWSATLDLAPFGEGWHVISALASDGSDWSEADVSVFVVLAGSVDLAVTSIDVVREPIQTDLVSVPNVVNERRTVLVTVENLGDENVSGGWVQAWIEPEGVLHFGSAAPHLGTLWVGDLPVGGSRTFAFEWDTTTTVGDVTIVAVVSHPWDGAPENDRAMKDGWVRVGGIHAGLAL